MTTEKEKLEYLRNARQRILEHLDPFIQLSNHIVAFEFFAVIDVPHSVDETELRSIRCSLHVSETTREALDRAIKDYHCRGVKPIDTQMVDMPKVVKQ